MEEIFHDFERDGDATLDEIAAYLDAAKATSFWSLLLTAISTGLHRSELVALRWQDIDLDAGTLTVAQAMGKYSIRPHKGKTEGSLCAMVIPDILVEELRRLKLRQAEERLSYGRVYRSDLDLVFTRAGGEAWQPSELTGRVANIARTSASPRTSPT
jgi:integrase